MNSIEIKDVSKKYKIYHDKSNTLKERLLFYGRSKFEEFKVIDNINLNIEKGEAVGLIGENGSGKSTLLKLLTKIIYPDQGKITINGKVSSLLELGAGFHPDFSGKENIYNNASIFGLSKAEIDKRYDKIVEFSEMKEFIDNPVRTYSSGMYMRLAFSVAINVDAELLLIDEILAVGDANFQKKCMDKIKELKRIGTTIVLVSHDLGSVEKICDKVVWLEKGSIKSIGNPRKIIDNYLMSLEQKSEQKLIEDEISNECDNNDNNENDRWGNKDIEITSVCMMNNKQEKRHLFNYKDFIEIQIKYKVNRVKDDVVFGIGIFTKDRIQCYGTNTFIDRIDITKMYDEGIVEFRIREIELVANSYTIDVAAHSKDGVPYDYITNSYFFDIYSDIKDVGIYKPEHEWILTGGKVNE